jgi:hypothetical protein
MDSRETARTTLIENLVGGLRDRWILDVLLMDAARW